MDDISTRNRGVKRKWREHPTDATVGAKISGKLHHDLKEVRKAGKKAKAFETQKLAKKLKSLRKQGGDENQIKETETQLEILKRTDHEPIANTALKTKLNKDHLLSMNVHIQASISTELAVNLLVSATPGTSEAKIQNRLLSSKTLATEVAVAVEDLKAVIQSEQKGGSLREVEDVEDTPVDIPNRHKRAKGTAYTEPDDGNMVEIDDGGDVGEDEEDHTGWESGTVGSEHEAEDSWESGSQNDEPIAQGSKFTSDSEDHGVQVKPTTAKQRKSTIVKATPKLTGITSTFLPSLSVGFTRGDSEGSEWSDDDAERNQKKNRRGQRARRAIWEKKYGKNANHWKAEHESAAIASRGRPDASDARHRSDKSKATLIGDRRSGRKDTPQHPRSGDKGWGQRTITGDALSRAGTSAQPIQPTRKREEQRLHPSWEAKRNLKQKQSAGILPAQGTKIKF